MKGCLAPSEVPGISPNEASLFGEFAENLIWADFCKLYPPAGNQVFRDHHNPASYLYFLAVNNPHFTEEMQRDYFKRAWAQKLAKIPDFAVHQTNEQSVYEVKPDSRSGFAAGVDKLGKLVAAYKYYRLPYKLGTRYSPKDHRVAFFGNSLVVTLKVRRAYNGLLLYKLCLRSDGEIEVTTLAILLAHIIRTLNQERRKRVFRPIDLEPAFRTHPQLQDVAKVLGLTFATAAAARVGWKYFWKAVAKRFAVRGGAAAALSAADGPLPFGELIAAGLAFWTVIDIIRLSDQLWLDAATIARKEI